MHEPSLRFSIPFFFHFILLGKLLVDEEKVNGRPRIETAGKSKLPRKETTFLSYLLDKGKARHVQSAQSLAKPERRQTMLKEILGLISSIVHWEVE